MTQSAKGSALFLFLFLTSLALQGCSDDNPSSGNTSEDAVSLEYPIAPTVDVSAPDSAMTESDTEDITTVPDDAGTTMDGDASDVLVEEEDINVPIDDVAAPIEDIGPDTVDGEEAVIEDANSSADTGIDVVEIEPDATEVDTTQPTSTIAETCFPWVLDPAAVGPSYDDSGAVIGSHCLGTNHQEIKDIERVVFLGDSVTVGTPNFEHLLPTDNNHYWRNMLAEDTIDLFGLEKGEDFSWGLWKSYDPFEQKGALNETGDFKNCAHWGARTKDFLEGDKQLEMCFPDGGSDKKTLVMFTVGGNDFKEIVEKGSESSEEDALAGYPAVWEEAESIIYHLEATIEWLTDPTRFPNGVSVIFANPYEYTDATGETSSCASAEVLSGVEAWQDTAALQNVSTWLADQFMQIAVSSQTDMVFMLERFCGHGYVMTGPNPDPSLGSPCDAGPDAEVWFDETCVHPNEAGHQAIYEMFKAVLLE